MSGRWYRRIVDAKELSDEEELLILWFMSGKSPRDAFLMVFPDCHVIPNQRGAKHTGYQARLILKQPRSIKYMREFLRKSFEKAVVEQQLDEEFFVKHLKESIEDAVADKKSRGLRLLAEALGIGQFNKTPEFDLDRDKLAGAIPIDEVPVIDADIPSQLGTGQDTQ